MRLSSILPSTTTTLIGSAVLLLGIAGTATATAVTDGATAQKASPKNSVTSKSIKNGTIKPADLSPALKNALGQPGATGPAGPPGAPGPAAIPNVRYSAPGVSEVLTGGVEKEVVSQTLPAATYHVSVDLNLVSNGEGIGSCAILTSGVTRHEAQYTFPAGLSRVPLTLSAVVAASPAVSPEVVCQTPENGSASNIRMVSYPVTLAN